MFHGDMGGLRDAVAYSHRLFNEVENVARTQRSLNRHPRVLIQWQPPEQEWIKANVDGAIGGSNNMVVVGVVFRDMAGSLISDPRSLCSCSVLMSELWVAYNDLIQSWCLGIRREIFNEPRDSKTPPFQ
ncbi:hypothetical protein GQ457_01G009600 [Hibiscus cannabinus]